ncbi:MAG: hypothetical protein KL863_05300 [Rhizobium sp.]|nr:hypothetical protein [Rhizobium sp.]
MMMSAPRESGRYGLRELDCRRAVETPALDMIFGSRAPFIDFVSLLHAILPAATAVGWEEAEIQSALETIVTDLDPYARQRSGST